MRKEFQSPDELNEFIRALIQQLKNSGLDAAPLENVQGTAYTSSSEWLGELGRAVIQIERQPISDPKTIDDLRRILSHVQRVWPSIRSKENDVPPELKVRVLANRYFGAPVMALIAAGIFRSVVAAGLRGDEPWLLLLLRGSLGMLFVWAAWYFWTSVNWSRRVAWVMRHTPPIPVRIEFSYVVESALAATLTPTEPACLKKVVFLCQDPSWDFKPLQGTVVQAYLDPEPKGPVIIRTPSGIIWPHERGRVERTYNRSDSHELMASAPSRTPAIRSGMADNP